MSLVKCQECNAEISSQAKTCPQCGGKQKHQSFGTKWGGRFLVFAFLAGMLELLVIGQLPKESAYPVTPLKPTPSVVEPQSKWEIETAQSAMDDSKSIYLQLGAENTIQAWLRNPRPNLYIRCMEGKTSVMINTGTPADPELGNFEEFTVRFRLDDGAAVTQLWGESTDGEALFAPRGVELAKKLAGASILTFEFTPHNSSPATVVFDLRGLPELLPQVADTCHWKYTPPKKKI